MSKTYVTKQGDMFDSIAFAQLGSTNFTDALMKENQQYHADYIFSAGIELTLPDVSSYVQSDAIPPWRRERE